MRRRRQAHSLAVAFLLATASVPARAGSPDWVPVEEGLAVFDNDGTLWPENPIPFQLA